MACDLKTTLEGEGVFELTEKKSRFIGRAANVGTEEEAVSFINGIKKKNADARHNVYAYYVNGAKRYSDDGEPQGTGGLPILDYIEKSGLSDVAVVVTRYFGGILLGTGGLTHAYLDAGKGACENAGFVTFELLDTVEIALPYTDYARLSKYFQSENIKICAVDYGENVTVKALIRKNHTKVFEETIKELTSGKYVPDVTGEIYDVL